MDPRVPGGGDPGRKGWIWSDGGAKPRYARRRGPTHRLWSQFPTPFIRMSGGGGIEGRREVEKGREREGLKNQGFSL